VGINHKKYYTLDTIKDLTLMKKIKQNFPGLKKINCINFIKKNSKFMQILIIGRGSIKQRHARIFGALGHKIIFFRSSKLKKKFKENFKSFIN
jgi:lactate dehydrogenase-like 2-hydroxyacid dehydrogenase